MKISPYMDINRIEFMVTYQCSGRCKHCSVSAMINQTGKIKNIPANAASRVVAELKKIFPVTSVMTFGGEPLLFPETVCAIHETADKCGIDKRQLITNGFFTKDDEKRKETARMLKAAGVNNLLLSVDAFHQETIPVEAVYNFARYSKEAGIINLRLHPAWVINQQHDNFYNHKTKDIISKFDDLGIPVSNGNNIIMAGSAIEYLARYYGKPHLNMSDSCGSMPYTEPLASITSLSVVPCGDVMICDFVIGNINTQSIYEIVSKYNPFENELMAAILTGGVSALIELSKRKGVFVDCSQCYSICDLCRKINRALVHCDI